jgi:hypothetical protein
MRRNCPRPVPYWSTPPDVEDIMTWCFQC